MPELIPIPLTRLQPLKPGSKPAPAAQSRPITITSTLVPTEPAAIEGPSPAQLSEEFDALSIKMRLHHSGEQLMDDQDYKTTLRRSIDLISSMNQTTAGPKAKNKKIGVEKQAPKSLADL